MTTAARDAGDAIISSRVYLEDDAWAFLSPYQVMLPENGRENEKVKCSVHMPQTHRCNLAIVHFRFPHCIRCIRFLDYGKLAISLGAHEH